MRTLTNRFSLMCPNPNQMLHSNVFQPQTNVYSPMWCPPIFNGLLWSVLKIFGPCPTLPDRFSVRGSLRPGVLLYSTNSIIKDYPDHTIDRHRPDKKTRTGLDFLSVRPCKQSLVQPKSLKN